VTLGFSLGLGHKAKILALALALKPKYLSLQPADLALPPKALALQSMTFLALLSDSASNEYKLLSE